MNDLLNKKILILGGSSECNLLVQTANDMGMRTIVIDPSPSAPAKAYAWKAYDVDAFDVDGMVDVFWQEQADGVMVGVSERILPYYCELCQRLSLPCYCTKEQLAVFCDKITFKKECVKNGIPVIRDYSPDDDIHYPIIVKPADSSGSKGQSVCRSAAKLPEAIKRAKKYTPTGRYLIEDYLNGDEITAFYTIVDGEPMLSQLSDRYVIKPYPEYGSIGIALGMPSKHSRLYIKTVHDNIRRMLKGMGFVNAAVNLQAFVADGTVRFYDPAVRLGGGGSYLITEKLKNTNAMRMLLRFAITGKMTSPGESCPLSDEDWKLEGKVAFQPNFIIRGGTIGKIEGIKKLREIDELFNVRIMRSEGDKIDLLGTSQQTVVRMFFLADSPAQINYAYQRAIDSVKITDEFGNNMILEQLDYRSLQADYERKQ